MSADSKDEMIIDCAQELSDQLTIHKNLSQEIIMTTSDKLYICLNENKDILEKKKEWMAPSGILIALMTTMVTAEFKDALGLKPETWQALFVFFSILSVIWLLKAVCNNWKNRKKQPINSIIEQMKKETQRYWAGSNASE